MTLNPARRAGALIVEDDVNFVNVLLDMARQQGFMFGRASQ